MAAIGRGLTPSRAHEDRPAPRYTLGDNLIVHLVQINAARRA